MGEFLKPSLGESACLCVPPRPSRPERVNALMLFNEWAEIPFGSQTEEATRTGIEKSQSQTCARICLSADLVSSSSSLLSSFRTFRAKDRDGFRVADSHGRSSGDVERGLHRQCPRIWVEGADQQTPRNIKRVQQTRFDTRCLQARGRFERIGGVGTIKFALFCRALHSSTRTVKWEVLAVGWHTGDYFQGHDCASARDADSTMCNPRTWMRRAVLCCMFLETVLHVCRGRLTGPSLFSTAVKKKTKQNKKPPRQTR